MNIFVLHKNPHKAARWHADKHVVKMILESVQMLYTAHWALAHPHLLECKSPIALSKAQKLLSVPESLSNAPEQKNGSVGYRPVHIHHPCTRWVRESAANYNWLCSLALYLAIEFRFRFGGEHSCEVHALWLSENLPAGIPDIPLTPFALAMPLEYKKRDAIQSYRAFYKGSKTERGITEKYTYRHRPHWLGVMILNR
jgi:hypothetical protein